MKSYRTLLPYLLRYRWRFFFGILFILAATSINVQVPVFVGRAINTITDRAGLMHELVWFGLFIIALAGLGGSFRYLMRRVLIDTSRDIEFDFRNDLYGHLQRLDPTFYDGHSTGDIMSRMTNDIDNVRMMIGPAIMYSVNALFVTPLVLYNMFALSVPVTIAGLAPMLIMPFVVKLFGSRMHKRSRAQQDQLAELTTFVQENLAGVRVLKAFTQEEPATRRFSVENSQYIDKSMQLALVEALFYPSIRVIAGMGLLAILYFSARGIVAGTLDFGTMVSLVMLFGMLLFPLIAAGWVVNIFQRAAAALDRINLVLDAKPVVTDSPALPGGELPKRLDLEIRDLTFTYLGGSQPALRNVSLRLEAGRTLGIVGRVGAGKSTLVHLLLRLYPVERGKVFLGGIDINDWPLEDLRRTVGIVFQETFLFSDTLAENVRFGALGEIDDQTVTDATTKADVHKDIAEFPMGYETLLGERGINLSGGQKQRLSIARALVRDPNVLILDDCLSAVDTHTEETILGHLRDVMRERSTILISHRISTVAMADEIIVLEDGEITQRGAHEELVAQGGLYAELYRKQQLEEEVEGIA